MERTTAASETAGRERALRRLQARIRRCEQCVLAAGRTQAVPGVGPALARVMFVGEAPGRWEDERGQPFVGTAGKFFDTLLASIGLSRGEVYITNAVKCRPFVGSPPGRNRAPRPAEIAACRGWLEEELAVVAPEIVVPMGRVAVECFLPGRKISELHGTPHREDGRVILPLYHPALGRYGPAARETLLRDFQVLGSMLRTKRPAPR